MKTIDVSGLSEKQAKLLAEFVDFLKQRLRQGQTVKKDKGDKTGKTKLERIQFATHSSDVKGKLTREEIYDYL